MGGASTTDRSLIRHQGREYGYIISGTLGVQIGFQEHVLSPGDSIAFDSTTPHRLFNVGDEPVHAIWFVVGRLGSKWPEGVSALEGSPVSPVGALSPASS